MNKAINKAILTNLPDNILQKIMGYLQTSRLVPDSLENEYKLNQEIIKKRKNLILGKGIKTDIRTVINLSSTCLKFRNHPSTKLLLTVYYNSKKYEVSNNLSHISFCNTQNCKDVCHYVNKDIKHTNIFSKISGIKNKNDYKVVNKPTRKPTRKINEASKFSESTELDTISISAY